jgi:hypothetical protein
MTDEAQAPFGGVPTGKVARWPIVVALLGAAVGLVFASYSTLDYVAHLDRQVHDIHCSIIPGAPVEQALESGCRTALYSPYSALLKDRIWGGVPISLFAVGAFAFFVSFCLYMLVGGGRVPRRGPRFLAAVGATPLLASIAMGVISAVKLGTFCQTCIGIYVASAVLAIGGIAAWLVDRKANKPVVEVPGVGVVQSRHLGAAWLSTAWLLGLGVFAFAPALLYLESVPSYRKLVSECGELETTEDPKEALLHVAQSGASLPATMVVDPLCPTCKAFHERLVSEGVFEQLDTTLVLFPLDSECNWNLNTPLHPGACTVARAVLCGEDRALRVLEWAYDNQEKLLAAAKSKDGDERVKKLIFRRWGKLQKCVEGKKSGQQLDEHLRYAVENKLPLSTPQLFLNDKRLCDEDLDIGLPYALSQLSPELSR